MSQHGSNGVREELLAAADLAGMGYQVFAPIVGYTGGCDLVAICLQTGAAIRVEVKRCVFRSPRADGTGMSYSNKPHPSRDGRYDVVAYVLVRENNRVEYVPPLARKAAASDPNAESVPRQPEHVRGPQMGHYSTHPRAL